jgi:hypothetical protein
MNLITRQAIWNDSTRPQIAQKQLAQVPCDKYQMFQVQRGQLSLMPFEKVLGKQ